MKRISILIVVALLGQESVLAGEPTTPGQDLRSVFIFANVGSLEIMNLGIGLQLSEQYSLALASSAFALGGKVYILPETALGIGVRGSYYFSPDGRTKFLWANVISCDLMYLLPHQADQKISFHSPGGVGIEAIIGRDGIVGSGIGISWGVGMAMSIHSEKPPLFFPAIKLGLHIDV